MDFGREISLICWPSLGQIDRSGNNKGADMRSAAILGVSLVLGSLSGHPSVAADGTPQLPDAAVVGQGLEAAAPKDGTLTLFTAPINQTAMEIRKGEFDIDVQTTNLREPEDVDRLVISKVDEESRIDFDDLNRPSRIEISDNLVVTFEYLENRKAKMIATSFDGFASTTKSATFTIPPRSRPRSTASRAERTRAVQTGGVLIQARLQACPAPYRYPQAPDVRFAVRTISPGIGIQDLVTGPDGGSNFFTLSFDYRNVKDALRDRDRTQSDLEGALNFTCGLVADFTSPGPKSPCKKNLGEACDQIASSIGDAICDGFEDLTKNVSNLRKGILNKIDGSFDAIPSFNYPDPSGGRVTVDLTPFRYKPAQGLKKINYVLVPTCFSRYQGSLAMAGTALAINKRTGGVACEASLSFAGRLQLAVAQSGIATFSADGGQRVLSNGVQCEWFDESRSKFSGQLPVSGSRIDVSTPDLGVNVLLSPQAAVGDVSTKSILFEDENFLQTGDMSGRVQLKSY